MENPHNKPDEKSLIYDSLSNNSVCNANFYNSKITSENTTYFVPFSDSSDHTLCEFLQHFVSDHITASLELSIDIGKRDDVVQSADVRITFECSEQNIEVNDSQFRLYFNSNLRIEITKKSFLESSEKRQSSSLSTTPLSSSTPRTPLTLPDRDRLRAMIVILNESNRVLLKIRQRFPLSASTRCDVIQCQIQMQLQELFGEFRSNDEEKFKEMIPQNRQTFLLIWDHLAQLIVDSCYKS